MMVGHRLLGGFVLLLAAGLLPPHALAQGGANRWASKGPWGGSVYALAVAPSNPKIIYTSTYNGGVFKSTNGGGSWNVTALTPDTVYALAVDPTDANTVYAGTFTGVFKSSDGGAAWSQSDAGMTDADLRLLTIDPVHPNTLYAVTAHSLYKSSDGGAAWHAINNGLVSLEISALVVDPARPNIVYAATRDNLAKSTDGGESWGATGIAYPGPFSLAIDPTNTNTLYAGVYPGIRKSTDGGATWVTLRSNTVAGQIVVNPLKPNIVYAASIDNETGVFRSTNAGNDWQTLSDGLPIRNVRALAIDGSRPDTLYAGLLYGEGVYKLVGREGRWAEANYGLNGSAVLGLAICSTAPNVLYSATDAGVFKSSDGGASWRLQRAAFRFAQAVAVAPSDPSRVYAGNSFGVYKSADGGTTWVYSSTGIVGGDINRARDVRALAVDPGNPDIVYAATMLGVYKTTNGGQTWNYRFSQFVGRNTAMSALGIDPAQPNTVFAGGFGPQYKTTDGGNNWLGPRGPSGLYQAYAISPLNPGLVFAANGVLIRSLDGGSTWRTLNVLTGSDFFFIESVALAPTDPNLVFAGTQGAGVYRSTDMGETWSALNAGLTHPEITALLISPADPRLVYAATVGGGVFSIRLDDNDFDLCMQDDSSGSQFQINSTTGAYRLLNCSGSNITGTGTINRKGSLVTLEHRTGDRTVTAHYDGGAQRATATIRLFSQGINLSITDRNTANSSCACQ